MKKRLMKLLSAGIVAVMLATTLAACGGNAVSEEAAPAESAAEETQEQEAETPAEEKEAEPAAPAADNAAAAAQAAESGEEFVQPEFDAADYAGIKCAFVCSDTGTVNGQKWLAGCKEAAEDLGLDFQAFDCKMDVTTQLQYLDECMTQGFGCVMVHPVDSSALADKIDEMEAAGINIGTINIRIDTNYSTHVGMPNYEAGIPLAEKIGELSGGKGKLVYIQGPVEVMQLVESDDALRDVFADKYPDIEIIDEANGDFSVEAGDQLTRDFITKYGADGFDIIIGMNDSMALGASQALSASGIDPSTKVITGGDGTDDALQAVKDGRISLTQLQLSKEWAKEGMNVLLNMHVKGETGATRGEREEHIHNMIMVDASNVDEYLGGAAPAAEEAPAEEEAEEVAFIGPVADASAYAGLKCAFVCSDTGTVNGQKWVNGCKEAAEDLGLECQIFDCKNDITNQIQYLNEVMTQEFDVCMIHPIDASALTDIVTEMEEAGINCGTINIRVDGVYTAHVGMPNYERGIPLARKIAEDMGGKARVVAIWGPVEVMQTMQYPDAVRDIWHDEFNDEMQIIDEANGDWSVESGDQLARDFLTKYGNDGFDVMLCGNDSMALGAAQALAASNVEGIYITGGDGTPDALQAVKDGRMSLTQLQMSKEWAKEGMTVLLNEHIQGQTGVERGERLEYLHTATIVTAENVDEFLQ